MYLMGMSWTGSLSYRSALTEVGLRQDTNEVSCSVGLVVRNINWSRLRSHIAILLHRSDEWRIYAHERGSRNCGWSVKALQNLLNQLLWSSQQP